MSFVRSVPSTRSWGESIAERSWQTNIDSETETRELPMERRKHLRSLILCKRRENFEDEYEPESVYKFKSDEAFPFYLFEEEMTYNQKNSVASSRAAPYNRPVQNSSAALYEKADKRAVKSFGFSMDEESSEQSDGDNGVFSWLGLGAHKNPSEFQKRNEDSRELEWRRLLRDESMRRISPTPQDGKSSSNWFVENEQGERTEEGEEEESVRVGGCYAGLFSIESYSFDEEENNDCDNEAEEREDLGISSIKLSPAGYTHGASSEETLPLDRNITDNCSTTPDHEKRGWLEKLVCKSEREHEAEHREDVGISSIRLSSAGYSAFSADNRSTAKDLEKRGWIKKVVCKSEQKQDLALYNKAEEREDAGESSVRRSSAGYSAFREANLPLEGNIADNCSITPDHERLGWHKKLVCKSEREQGPALLSEDTLHYNAPSAYLPIMSSLSQQSPDEHSSYVESSTQTSWYTRQISQHTHQDSESKKTRPANDGLLSHRSKNPPRDTISRRAKVLPPLGNLRSAKKRAVYRNDDEFGLMSLAPF